MRCLQTAWMLFKDTTVKAQRKYMVCIRKDFLKDQKKATVVKDQSTGDYYKQEVFVFKQGKNREHAFS